MNAKYAKEKYELEWGEVTQEDILRKIYKQKSLEEKCDEEIDKMLDDLI